MLHGMQVVPKSIPASTAFFREELVMNIFLHPFFLFHQFKKSSCQLIAKECKISIGRLPLGGLPRSNEVSYLLTVLT